MENNKEKTQSYSTPKNLLTPCVLLLLQRVSNYGYQIIQDLVEFGFTSVDPGYVYRILRQLENEKLVQSHWEISTGGPPKRMYSITEAGIEHLGIWSCELERYQYTLDRFFAMYERILFHSIDKKR
ncbi:helix-turn-helix transcriptional regulator [Aneurinibacillus sp. REN35]|uniref:helix-turn-helix transcriptional regulator n=1 Tax=Aneurinibacillus sp. REN35 TaxID=3237286 RepID=UPI0035292251